MVHEFQVALGRSDEKPCTHRYHAISRAHTSEREWSNEAIYSRRVRVETVSHCSLLPPHEKLIRSAVRVEGPPWHAKVEKKRFVAELPR